MEDCEIVNLYFDRNERAIAATRTKYGRVLCGIAYGILKDTRDAEECESDTYIKTWSVIPPTRPYILSAFLAKITRGLSLDRYDYLRAQKRGGGEMPLLLDELAECVPDQNGLERYESEFELQMKLNMFLRSLKKDARIIFMRRYWFGDSVAEISKRYDYSASKVKTSLMRSRNELQAVLESEDNAI